MLRNQPLLNAMLIDLLLGTIWHYATFFLCISIKPEHFNPKRARYQSRKWEKNGKWYADYLKINKWKDFLPQHVAKDGFSKDHLDDVSIEYLDEFIFETCRGEWNHLANCYFAIVLFIINSFWIALILSILLLLGNLPFAVIQRYNRFRLIKLKNTLIKKAQRAGKHKARLEAAQKESEAREQVSVQDSDGEAVSG